MEILSLSDMGHIPDEANWRNVEYFLVLSDMLHLKGVC